MKMTMKKALGVTLLEVMLVLAIAAMIIVMSVRYYQTATSSQQANQSLQIIQGITAAADQVAMGGSSYSIITSANVGALMPGGKVGNAPWGGKITVSAGTDGTKYSVSIANTPTAVCSQLFAKLNGNKKYSGLKSTCTAGAAFDYTYDSTAN